MNKTVIAHALALALLATASLPVGAGPTGAKAIFDSGNGGSIAMSSGTPRPAPAAPAPVAAARPASNYVGISYQIMSLAPDGQILPVTRNRVFHSGERLKILARTNRPGYLTVLNIGPSGNTHVLFSELVEPFRMIEVPRNANLKMVGAPGTERLLFMLSNEPNPMAPPQQSMTQAAAAPVQGMPQQPYAAPAAEPAPAPVAAAGLPPPPAMMLAGIDGAKSLKGAKDLVVEDDMKSSYSVISPQDAWKPRQLGMKDVVLESDGGVQYGVVPVSAMARGGILTLEIKLRHQ